MLTSHTGRNAWGIALGFALVFAVLGVGSGNDSNKLPSERQREQIEAVRRIASEEYPKPPEAPTFRDMDPAAVKSFFDDKIGRRVRLRGTIIPYQGTPGIRLLSGDTHVVLGCTQKGNSPFVVISIFSGAKFCNNLLDYRHGEQVEITGRTVGRTQRASTYLVVGSTIQKIAQPESVVSVKEGRQNAISSSERERLLNDYRLVYRNPDAFKGRRFKGRGRITAISSKKGAAIITIGMELGEKPSSRQVFYLSRTRIRFSGDESFDWFLDYDEETDVDFEVEITGDGTPPRRKDSPYPNVLMTCHPIVLAKGITIQGAGNPDTMVRVDGGRRKPVKDTERYLERCDVVGREPSRFYGKKVAWRIVLDSIRTRGKSTAVTGTFTKVVTLHNGHSVGRDTKVSCYFPGGEFIHNFMDFVPGDSVRVVGKLSEQNRDDKASFGCPVVFLQGVMGSRAADKQSTVFADKGRLHPIARTSELRKRFYVIRRSPSRFAGTEVTWRGKGIRVRVWEGKAYLDLDAVDPIGSLSRGARLFFPDESFAKRLRAFVGKPVVFAANVIGERDWFVLPELNAVSIMLAGKPNTRLQVSPGASPSQGPKKTR